jgi:hypothetical protein
VFIRPRILRDAEATESTSEEKYGDVRRQQQNISGGHITLLPGEKQPVVPSIPYGIALPPSSPPSDTNPQGATPNQPRFSVPAPQSAPPATTPAPPPPRP